MKIHFLPTEFCPALPEAAALGGRQVMLIAFATIVVTVAAVRLHNTLSYHFNNWQHRRLQRRSRPTRPDRFGRNQRDQIPSHPKDLCR